MTQYIKDRLEYFFFFLIIKAISLSIDKSGQLFL